jgi:uncharacterized membrane protein YqaE (UPF0057 family)
VVACCLPPLAVGLRRGPCTHVWFINVLLTLLGWVPGFVHAELVVHEDDARKTAVRAEQAALAATQQIMVEGPRRQPVCSLLHSQVHLRR